MKKIHLIIALFIGFSLASCKQETPKFVGEWKLEKIDMAGEEIFANVLGKFIHSYNEDKTYIFKVDGQSEEGTWSLENDVLTLTPKDSEEKKILTIVSVDDKKFVYKTGDDAVSTVYLTK